MGKKEELLAILEKSREAERTFIASLSEDEKAETGTYENWSAKDNLAHANYWMELRARQNLAFILGEKFEPVPQYEQANLEVYERFAQSDWSAIEALEGEAYDKMIEVLNAADEAALEGPSAETEDRKMWEMLVGSFYSHKLLHYSQYYEDHDRKKEVGMMWKAWADSVSPLDPGPDWQGGVHYNAACSLALVGDKDGALEALIKGLDLRPGLKAWSRLDSDLESLHDDPTYRDYFAPDYWWKAFDAGPQAEALADQWLRMFFMLRNAINTLPAEEWVAGETLYQRPVGLVLHILQSVDYYAGLEPGDGSEHELTQVGWQERDSGKFPDQAATLAYLEVIEQRLTNFLVKADFQASEELFNWTGKTVMSRVLYSLRHACHHLADLSMELKRRGFEAPNWE
jgi:hypothetical protein